MPPFAHAGGGMRSSRPTADGAMVWRHDPMPPFARGHGANGAKARKLHAETSFPPTDGIDVSPS